MFVVLVKVNFISDCRRTIGVKLLPVTNRSFLIILKGLAYLLSFKLIFITVEYFIFYVIYLFLFTFCEISLHRVYFAELRVS